MATAGTHDIIIDQGARWSLAFTWQDSNGDPVDLTGYTINAQVRTTYADSGGTLLAEATATITDEAGGEFTLSIPAATTEAMTPGSWLWDVEADPGDGEVERLVMGRAIVRGEVTRD